MLSKQEHQVEIPDTTRTTNVVLGSPLGQGDESELTPPNIAVRVAIEEGLELESSKATKPKQILIVDWFVGANGTSSHAISLSELGPVSAAKHANTVPLSSGKTSTDRRCDGVAFMARRSRTVMVDSMAAWPVECNEM